MKASCLLQIFTLLFINLDELHGRRSILLRDGDELSDKDNVKEIANPQGSNYHLDKPFDQYGGVSYTAKDKESFPNSDKQIQEEYRKGNMADLLSNRHERVPSFYSDLSRRFVLQYPYHKKEFVLIDEEAEAKLNLAVQEAIKRVANDERLRPVKAPPDVVMAVAKQSAMQERAKPLDHTIEQLRKDILRTGDYWNAVWKEDVPDPTGSHLRSEKHIESVRVKIMPGSKLYKVAKAAKAISPRLLYIINNKNDQ